MNRLTDPVMNVDYSKKNLQKSSFIDESLMNTSFQGSDLRGADFSGANLTGANLTEVKTGIAASNNRVIFLVALVISMLSGYVAMLAGRTIQGMLKSDDEKIKTAGIISLILIVVFVGYYYLKGGRTVIRHLLLPAFILSLLIGVIAYFSGLGTGEGMLFLMLVLVLAVVMIAIGTVARAIAGVLSSSILFIFVAAAGSMFGTTVGGGIGSVAMAIACALISKRASSGAKGFDALKKVAFLITSRFGTSFRGANLTSVNFSDSKINNADFTNADLSSVIWGDSKKENCIVS